MEKTLMIRSTFICPGCDKHMLPFSSHQLHLLSSVSNNSFVFSIDLVYSDAWTKIRSTGDELTLLSLHGCVVTFLFFTTRPAFFFKGKNSPHAPEMKGRTAPYYFFIAIKHGKCCRVRICRSSRTKPDRSI